MAQRNEDENNLEEVFKYQPKRSRSESSKAQDSQDKSKDSRTTQQMKEEKQPFRNQELIQPNQKKSGHCYDSRRYYTWKNQQRNRRRNN